MSSSLSKPKFEKMAAMWTLTVRLEIISVHFLSGTFYEKDERIKLIRFNFNVWIFHISFWVSSNPMQWSETL